MTEIDLSMTDEFAITEARRKAGQHYDPPIDHDDYRNVAVLHAFGPGMFRPFTEVTMLEEAYRYGVNPEALLLDEIWRWNNTVDGTEHNVAAGTRSLSVGDVVGMHTFDEGWRWFAVEASGWRTVSSQQVYRALERGTTFDPMAEL